MHYIVCVFNRKITKTYNKDLRYIIFLCYIISVIYTRRKMNERQLNFGAKIRFFRKTQNISQEQLAKIVGVSCGYISNLENGKINPTLSTITKLSTAVGAPISALTNNDNLSNLKNLKFSPKFEILFEEIRSVGKFAKESFVKNDIIYFKEKTNKSDIVTDIDLILENRLIRIIRKHFPELIIKSEESYNEKLLHVSNTSNIAIIDPLDGTANFFANIPYFCISLFIDSEKDGKCGVIYDPITDVLLIGNPKKIEIRQNGEEYIIYANDVSCKKNFINDVTCAIISDYNTPSTVTEPFIEYLYSEGIKRVVSLWSPSHDYMNLMMNKYDCIISFSKPNFSEAAGLFFVEISKNNSLNIVSKDLLNKRYYLSISTRNSYTKSIVNLVKNYKTSCEKNKL